MSLGCHPISQARKPKPRQVSPGDCTVLTTVRTMEMQGFCSNIIKNFKTAAAEHKLGKGL